MAENVNETLIANAIGGGGGASDDIRKRLILAMLQEGTSGAPVAHFTQGLDRIAKAMLGGLELRDLDRSDREFQRSQGDYLRNRFGVGPSSPGASPSGGRSVESGPRSASLPPMAVEPEPQRPPPGTVPTPRNLTSQNLTPLNPTPDDLTAMHASPEAQARSQMPLPGITSVQAPSPDVAAALAQMKGGLEQGLGRGQPNSLVPPQPQPPVSPATALQSPQGLAGAVPPPLAPPGPPAQPPQQPLMPPAPRADQAAQPPEMTPEQRQKAIRLLSDRRTSPAVRKQIEEDLSPEWKYQVAGNELWRFTKSGRHERVADATKDPDAVRTAEAMFRNPERFGLRRGADLDDAITQRLSGLTTPENKFGTAAAGVFAKRYETLLEVGGKAQEQIANINSLRELSQGLNTGKDAEIKAALGPWAEFFGIKIDKLGEIQAYEAVSQKMAAAMYVPGTGQQSNFEMQGFLKQVPTLGKTPEGNAIINRTMEMVAAHRVKVSEIAQQALTRQITPQEAEKQIRELSNPLALWKKSQSAASGAGGPAGPGRTFNPQTGKFE